ncbi:hypothetical protein GCM10010299_09740 [Streptomyces tanashiensis]|nr:hypothetical protein GCM10010299_09740 [Streptomyces tanashiensis]
MSVAAITSRAPNARTLTRNCRAKADSTHRATAPRAPSSKIPSCAHPVITEAIATVRKPNGMGEAMGRRLIRVIDRRSGSKRRPGGASGAVPPTVRPVTSQWSATHGLYEETRVASVHAATIRPRSSMARTGGVWAAASAP